MLKYHNLIALLLVALMTLTACEKPLFADEERSSGNAHKGNGNLTLNVTQIEKTSFDELTRATAEDACTHLNFLVYDMDGTRLKSSNQKLGDNDFGSASFQLDEGQYQIVIVAHSSEKNPSSTNPAKIQFNNDSNGNAFSDTFLYNNMITIGSEPQSLDLTLHRIVALCRFIISDAIPAGVAQLRFEYKGGSGAFDASTGLGCVKSTQRAYYTAEKGKAQTQYDLYTFLHDTEGTIHLMVTAYDANAEIMQEREFDIPLTQNQVTWYSGNFFSASTPSVSHGFSGSVAINSQWAGETHMSY